MLSWIFFGKNSPRAPPKKSPKLRKTVTTIHFWNSPLLFIWYPLFFFILITNLLKLLHTIERYDAPWIENTICALSLYSLRLYGLLLRTKKYALYDENPYVLRGKNYNTYGHTCTMSFAEGTNLLLLVPYTFVRYNCVCTCVQHITLRLTAYEKRVRERK